MQDEGGAKAGQNAGFRVMLKYFEIKKAFRYYIKQIDSMLPCVWFSNRSRKTSKCGKNISDTLGYASCATYLFLPHFDVICDLLLNRRTATWNLFVKLIFSQLEKRLRDLQDSHDKEENALRVQIGKLQQEKRQLQDTLAQYQTNEQKQKQEFDQVLYRAQEMQEMLERETQEKFASMAEQKSLRQQVENLSKNMKSLQVSTWFPVMVLLPAPAPTPPPPPHRPRRLKTATTQTDSYLELFIGRNPSDERNDETQRGAEIARDRKADRRGINYWIPVRNWANDGIIIMRLFA